MSEHVELLKRRHYRSATPSCIVGALLSYSLMLRLRHLQSSRLCDGSYVLGPTAQFRAIVRTPFGNADSECTCAGQRQLRFSLFGVAFPVDVDDVPGDHQAFSSRYWLRARRSSGPFQGITTCPAIIISVASHQALTYRLMCFSTRTCRLDQGLTVSIVLAQSVSFIEFSAGVF